MNHSRLYFYLAKRNDRIFKENVQNIKHLYHRVKLLIQKWQLAIPIAQVILRKRLHRIEINIYLQIV